MKIAFIAADAYELAPLAQLRPGAWSIAGGTGFGLARRAASQAAEQGAQALVSTGVCGALSPTLALGDIVVDERGKQPHTDWQFRSGRVTSQDRVAVTVAEKRALAESGAMAVDMESAAVAEVACERGLPFYCIKAVSDTAVEEMPLDFNRYRDPEGRFNRMRIVMAALGRPAVFPRLIRLNQNAKLAAESLGEFLAHCEF